VRVLSCCVHGGLRLPRSLLAPPLVLCGASRASAGPFSHTAAHTHSPTHSHSHTVACLSAGKPGRGGDGIRSWMDKQQQQQAEYPSSIQPTGACEGERPEIGTVSGDASTASSPHSYVATAAASIITTNLPWTRRSSLEGNHILGGRSEAATGVKLPRESTPGRWAECGISARRDNIDSIRQTPQAPTRTLDPGSRSARTGRRTGWAGLGWAARLTTSLTCSTECSLECHRQNS
jgi:hypothetical protein